MDMKTGRWRFDIRSEEGYWVFHYEEHFVGDDGAAFAQKTAEIVRAPLSKLFPVAEVDVKDNVIHAKLHGSLASIANFMVGEFLPMSEIGSLSISRIVQILGAIGLQK
jgi:hypothetical protein